MKLYNIDPENIDFSEKGMGIVSSSHFVCDFSKKKNYHVILTDLISLPDCLHLLRYWSICVLQLFIKQVVMS